LRDFVDLTGKTVLVTGGSRGIGEAIVRTCAEHGAHVVLNYSQSGDQANAIAQEIGTERCLVVQADVGKLDDVERLWREAVAWQGAVDVLVNNADVREDVPLEAPAEEWDAVWRRAFEVNLLGAAHLSRNAILHYRERAGGIIIGLSARVAVRGDVPTAFQDGALMGSINSLMRGIARFFAADNVLTYIIACGVIETDQAKEYLDLHGREEMLAQIPLGEFGTPQQIADLAVFLASGRARYATGATIDSL
jgi:3-oxoacyl-[acyl-carrier protein] reductase